MCPAFCRSHETKEGDAYPAYREDDTRDSFVIRLRDTGQVRSTIGRLNEMLIMRVNQSMWRATSVVVAVKCRRVMERVMTTTERDAFVRSRYATSQSFILRRFPRFMTPGGHWRIRNHVRNRADRARARARTIISSSPENFDARRASRVRLIRGTHGSLIGHTR
ncbi:hypothetical protein ALC53_09018 [Atta colombica]|uniref:Uncharacterized protein n=1 Tax=Atta colombica TaxID=520822 RepID=A0A195B7G9_9HYME|nr:hypothetical protein ALC53_09018 [Atta colombica]